MRIRREQGLFLIVLVLGLWMWSSSESEATGARLRFKPQDYEAAPLPADALVPALAEPQPPTRDPFLEPSESSPLPPRALPFPDLGALPVVALPLPTGQFPGAYHQLRVPGGVVQAFQFQAALEEGGGPVEPDGERAEPEPGNGGGAGTDPGLLYDLITLRDGRKVYGFIRKPDKYSLVGKRGTFTEPIFYDWVAVKTGVILKTNDELAPGDVLSVVLADTLRNRIELHRRSLGTGVASLPDRRAFIDSLLRDARNESWIYEVARREAEEYVRISEGDVEGYELVVRVLRERGDLSGEWRLYQELPARHRDSAFLHRSMGSFKARFGLDIEAEEHLRRAVELDPPDPRCRLALARFLLQRGRPAAALPHVEAARRNRALLVTDDQLFAMWTELVRTHLALGDLRAARRALSSLPTGPHLGARRDELTGAVAYAERDVEEAARVFARAVSAGARGDAALGLAACQILQGRWAEAETGLRSVAESYPLLRHRAQAGLGLLYERTDNPELALAALESAARADPTDPYVQYLLGRTRRLTGQADGAIEALSAALELSDELVEAHAELAETYLAMAEGGGDEAVEALYKARRHVDRLVELDRPRGDEVRYRELQGVIRFRAADRRGARQAFAGVEQKSRVCRVGLALVEYAQNHVEDARGMLEELKRELRTGDELRDYVTRTIELIEDHADKEQVRDGFEREQLGRNWDETQSNDAVAARPRDGVLAVRGVLRRPARPVFARRLQPTGGNFLQAEVTIVVGPKDRSKDAALQIATVARGGRARPEFRARIGFHDQRPQLLIEDGDVERARDEAERQKWDPVELPTVSAVPGTPQRLQLEVAPREGSSRFELLAYWNGELVHQREIEKLHAKTKTPLAVDLLVEGSQNDEVDVSFDDFRLERRREK